MCGIAGQVSLSGSPLPSLAEALLVMNRLLRHRGPDGEGGWEHSSARVGFAHRRLSIIDLDTGAQPMRDPAGNWLTYNGEIYNYIELRQELGEEQFRTTSDTEVILRAYEKWGVDCVTHLRGMFAFALWDEARQRLFCARDRFGIKPFYYAVVGDVLLFASEVKALLPFLPAIETDLEGLKDYLAFQFCLAGKTLFQGVRELPAGHTLSVERGIVREQRYWEVYYDLDFSHTDRYFQERLVALLEDSTRVHLRADVPIGAYISGGLDSSIVASLASQTEAPLVGFTGKFLHGPEYDETQYARALAEHRGFPLHEIGITGTDFVDHIRKVIYHLDYPVAGPGSFPQYMVSDLASRHRKVVLGGQGGDEIFGGYARYLIAYFEQCIKAAIDGTRRSGNFVVTYESIIPNLTTLRSYKPLLQEFWREGLFEPMDKRYFRLINRSGSLDGLVDWTLLGDYSPFETFRTVFHGSNVGKESYFDQMTHFDFKTLLPALLHVEDRVSMAHGLESRVPLLDHPIVELAATAPADIKFKDGHLKHLLRNALGHVLPPAILNRTDKMGFPTPLTEFVQTDARQFVQDVFSSKAARQRTIINNARVLEGLADQPRFSRKLWGLLSLELWQQEFHDRQAWFKGLINEVSIQGQIT
jgi:asparagine synthase (glutamine-hydrolysing)